MKFHSLQDLACRDHFKISNCDNYFFLFKWTFIFEFKGEQNYQNVYNSKSFIAKHYKIKQTLHRGKFQICKKSEAFE